MDLVSLRIKINRCTEVPAPAQNGQDDARSDGECCSFHGEVRVSEFKAIANTFQLQCIGYFFRFCVLRIFKTLELAALELAALLL
jgi:hypothetical protein